jgi:hypothetical protein
MLKNAKEIELGENKTFVLSGILHLCSVLYYGIQTNDFFLFYIGSKETY